MKRTNAILLVCLFNICSCSDSKHSDSLISLDVNSHFPKKELLLQDFMDVKYIPLETSDDFLCQGTVLDIGQNIILVKNDFPDGNVFIFDTKGKGIKCFNHRGDGGEEYSFVSGAVLDEANGEIFINDPASGKIMVYDLNGEFIRQLKIEERLFGNIYNYDNGNLICDLGLFTTSETPQIIILSKKNGSIIRKIRIPYKNKKSTAIDDGNGSLLTIFPYHPIIPYKGEWILSEASSDTIFSLSSNYSLDPFIARRPSIQSTTPEIFLFPKILINDYYLLEKVKKEKNFTKTDLLYDKRENAFFEYTLFNGDYLNKQKVNTVLWRTKNDQIAYWQKIEAHSLVDLYKKGELKGKLKDIAATLEEDSNPVIMIARSLK